MLTKRGNQSRSFEFGDSCRRRNPLLPTAACPHGRTVAGVSPAQMRRPRRGHRTACRTTRQQESRRTPPARLTMVRSGTIGILSGGHPTVLLIPFAKAVLLPVSRIRGTYNGARTHLSLNKLHRNHGLFTQWAHSRGANSRRITPSVCWDLISDGGRTKLL
jgi:hypothetical protein